MFYLLFAISAKEQWGQTSEYKEFEEKTKNWAKDDEATAANEFMQLFVEFGQMKEMNPADEQVQLQVRKLQDYITNHFYTCSDKILCGLGRMYAGGGESLFQHQCMVPKHRKRKEGLEG